MKEFKEGDRVRMQSACAQLYGETSKTLNPSRLLRGVVELWADGALIVRWDDWPLVTALPNPNVELEDGSVPPEAA